jgi:hypothetical protein
MKPKLKPTGTKRLKLKCDILLSNSAFKFKLCRYNQVKARAARARPVNWYKLLGVEAHSGAPEIKKAYRQLALVHHPDKAGGQVYMIGGLGTHSRGFRYPS